MKTQELSIGNIVEVNHFEYGDMFASVTSINDVGDLCLHLLDEIFTKEEYECTINEVVPIPITEELLTKIGFILPEHKEFYVMCRINEKDNSIRLTRYFNLWNAEIFASHPEVVMLEHTIKGLRFVHELQNAYYFATGKELEIKL